MRDKQMLKVSVSIKTAEQLLNLPEFKGMTITKIIHQLTYNKLNNTNANERGDYNENNHNN